MHHISAEQHAAVRQLQARFSPEHREAGRCTNRQRQLLDLEGAQDVQHSLQLILSSPGGVVESSALPKCVPDTAR